MENLAFYAGVYGVTQRSRLEEVIELLGLHGLENMRAGQISAGWRQRLAFGHRHCPPPAPAVPG